MANYHTSNIFAHAFSSSVYSLHWNIYVICPCSNWKFRLTFVSFGFIGRLIFGAVVPLLCSAWVVWCCRGSHWSLPGRAFWYLLGGEREPPAHMVKSASQAGHWLFGNFFCLCGTESATGQGCLLRQNSLCQFQWLAGVGNLKYNADDQRGGCFLWPLLSVGSLLVLLMVLQVGFLLSGLLFSKGESWVYLVYQLLLG